MEKFRQVLFVHLLSKLHQDRTARSAYHLLKGKRSAQTIQDARLYQMLEYFGAVPAWSDEVFERDIFELEAKNYIEKGREEGFYTVTPAGNRAVQAGFNMFPFSRSFHGFHFKDDAPIFWERLQLAVQTVSFITAGNTSFVPISSKFEVQQQIRKWYYRYDDKLQLSRSLLQELYTGLAELSDKEACLLTSQLTGRDGVGLTIRQLSRQQDEEYIRTLFWGVVHHLTATVKSSPEQFPVLHALSYDLTERSTLTYTAQKTLLLLEQGYSFSDIVQFRKLKPSTIEDHFVEIAGAVEGFRFNELVSEQVKQKVVQVSKQENTKRLKLIKMSLDAEQIEATYFEIRLALALGGKEEL
ncbi:helix-turn-helix domain-containing protein [Salsuginibacillus kocurii]|uniref:helix-turn-helix domain-containing protein n=1 Tax=Salsuginibacillus kocurii TaxID=427078 RepID=UPI00036FA87B|nr:helix-turn-helix domain-containing protein [Salsuginibacillus kocurii]